MLTSGCDALSHIFYLFVDEEEPVTSLCRTRSRVTADPTFDPRNLDTGPQAGVLANSNKASAEDDQSPHESEVSQARAYSGAADVFRTFRQLMIFQ
jgi:hypothetical protein